MTVRTVIVPVLAVLLLLCNSAPQAYAAGEDGSETASAADSDHEPP